MTLKARITEDMKNAMRAHDAARLSTIRMLLAAIKQREVDERIELDRRRRAAVIEKMMKQRKDSIAQFEAGHREDLAAKERAEIERAHGLSAGAGYRRGNRRRDRRGAGRRKETGAAGMAGMGKVMAILKPKLAGRADMARGFGQGQGETAWLTGAPECDLTVTAGRRPVIWPYLRSSVYGHRCL